MEEKSMRDLIDSVNSRIEELKLQVCSSMDGAIRDTKIPMALYLENRQKERGAKISEADKNFFELFLNHGTDCSKIPKLIFGKKDPIGIKFRTIAPAMCFEICYETLRCLYDDPKVKPRLYWGLVDGWSQKRLFRWWLGEKQYKQTFFHAFIIGHDENGVEYLFDPYLMRYEHCAREPITGYYGVPLPKDWLDDLVMHSTDVKVWRDKFYHFMKGKIFDFRPELDRLIESIKQDPMITVRS